MPWATSTKGVSPSVIRGRAISATFNTTAGSNCPAYQMAVVKRRYVIQWRCREWAGTGGQLSGTRSLEWWPVGSGRRGACCVINPTDSKAQFPTLSKLAFSSHTCGHTATYVCPRACKENASLYAVWMGFTAPYIAVHWCTRTYGDANRSTVHQRPECVNVRRSTQGCCKERKVQNIPLIWRMSDHTTNSSHITDHFLSTLLSFRYMRCIACCWKSRLKANSSESFLFQ